tara:strand:+ start:36 stop:512 length:477 start_codon:yes stop_codon:yes gene_type:complete
MKPGLGKKKDLNTELNLTPFIDLLSTCVCFLLITAVWIEIGALEIKQSTGTEAADSTKKRYDLDIVYSSPQLVNLNLKKGGKRIKSYKVEGKEYSEIVEKLNDLIPSQVLNFKNQVIKISTATITPKSTVNYGQMVKVMDVLRNNEIVNIGVLTARGR